MLLLEDLQAEHIIPRLIPHSPQSCGSEAGSFIPDEEYEVEAAPASVPSSDGIWIPDVEKYDYSARSASVASSVSSFIPDEEDKDDVHSVTSSCGSFIPDKEYQ